MPFFKKKLKRAGSLVKAEAVQSPTKAKLTSSDSIKVVSFFNSDEDIDIDDIPDYKSSSPTQEAPEAIAKPATLPFPYKRNSSLRDLSSLEESNVKGEMLKNTLSKSPSLPKTDSFSLQSVDNKQRSFSQITKSSKLDSVINKVEKDSQKLTENPEANESSEIAPPEPIAEIPSQKNTPQPSGVLSVTTSEIKSKSQSAVLPPLPRSPSNASLSSASSIDSLAHFSNSSIPENGSNGSVANRRGKRSSRKSQASSSTHKIIINKSLLAYNSQVHPNPPPSSPLPGSNFDIPFSPNRSNFWLPMCRLTLATIPPSLWECRNIRKLSLTCNQIESVPPQIGKLDNLEVLDLSYNQITECSPEIGKLSNLSILYLNDNHLVSFPETLRFCKNLFVLDISNNNLENLPLFISEPPFSLNLKGSRAGMPRLRVSCPSIPVSSHIEFKGAKEIIDWAKK